jgi:hypothetical protein
MARIRTRDEFKSSILLRLGEPVVNLVVQQYGTVDCAVTGVTGVTGTESVGTTGTGVTGTSGCPQIVASVLNQLDIVIDDALDYFKNASSGSSNEKDVLILQLQSGKSVYQVCDDVLAIEQPLSDTGTGGDLGFSFDAEETQAAVGLFSWQSQFGSRGIFGHTGGIYDNLLTTEIALEYASLIEQRYTKKFEVQFNDYAKEIIVFPTPTDSEHGRCIAMITTRETSDEKCFRDLWLQRYATALLARQVGANTSSFTGFQLPGGGEWNAEFYNNFADTQIEKLEEELPTGKYGNAEWAGGLFYTG